MDGHSRSARPLDGGRLKSPPCISSRHEVSINPRPGHRGTINAISAITRSLVSRPARGLPARRAKTRRTPTMPKASMASSIRGIAPACSRLPLLLIYKRSKTYLWASCSYTNDQVIHFRLPTCPGRWFFLTPSKKNAEQCEIINRLARAPSDLSWRELTKHKQQTNVLV